MEWTKSYRLRVKGEPEYAENVKIRLRMKWKRLNSDLMDNLPHGTFIGMTPKDRMMTKVFVEFFRHFAKYRMSGPNLFLFDDETNHLDYTIAEEAELIYIILYLPYFSKGSDKQNADCYNAA